MTADSIGMHTDSASFSWDDEWYIYRDDAIAWYERDEHIEVRRPDPSTSCMCENSHCPVCAQSRGGICTNPRDEQDPRFITYLGTGSMCNGCTDEYVSLGYLEDYDAFSEGL